MESFEDSESFIVGYNNAIIEIYQLDSASPKLTISLPS